MSTAASVVREPRAPRNPPGSDAFALAALILLERIESLSEASRSDLLELFSAWPTASAGEDRESILRAIAEIAENPGIAIVPMDLDAPMPSGLKSWAAEVGARVRSARAEAGLTQAELAEKSGIRQSHISRIENGEHSATHKTLAKLAEAMGTSVEHLQETRS
jgi:DNA-binding XRE family transcriptional regulator